MPRVYDDFPTPGSRRVKLYARKKGRRMSIGTAVSYTPPKAKTYVPPKPKKVG